MNKVKINDFLYGVFTADGCECKFLSGLFTTQEKAFEFQEKLKEDPYVYGDKDLVSVERLPLNTKLDPLLNYKVEKTNAE